MSSGQEKDQMTLTTSEEIFNILDAEYEEEEEYELDDDDDDLMTVEEPLGISVIRDLKPNTSYRFKGIVLWKKKLFRGKNGKTDICRVRVGDDKNHQSIMQISGLNEGAHWIAENLQYGNTYIFAGLRLRKSNRRYVPVSHPCEAVVVNNLSSAKRIQTPSHFPTRLYYDFKNFAQISEMTVSTCIEIVGVILNVGEILRRQNHYIHKIVLVDSFKFKLPFYLWNEDIDTFNVEPGMTMLLQGLKVMFSYERVDFAVLRCKHVEVNPELAEAQALSTWWWKDGGKREIFSDFTQFEDRFQTFVNALNEYKNAPVDNKPRYTVLAEKYHLTYTTLVYFFLANGIRKQKVHNVNPEQVAQVAAGYVANKKLNPVHTIDDEIKLQNATVQAHAVRMHRHLTSQSTPQEQRPKDAKDTKQKTELFLNRKPGQTAKDIFGDDKKAAARVYKQSSRAGRAPKKTRGQPGKIARALLLSLDSPQPLIKLNRVPLSHFEALAKEINKREPDEDVTANAINSTFKKCRNEQNWEAKIRQKAEKN